MDARLRMVIGERRSVEKVLGEATRGGILRVIPAPEKARKLARWPEVVAGGFDGAVERSGGGEKDSVKTSEEVSAGVSRWWRRWGEPVRRAGRSEVAEGGRGALWMVNVTVGDALGGILAGDRVGLGVERPVTGIVWIDPAMVARGFGVDLSGPEEMRTGIVGNGMEARETGDGAGEAVRRCSRDGGGGSGRRNRERRWRSGNFGGRTGLGTVGLRETKAVGFWEKGFTGFWDFIVFFFGNLMEKGLVNSGRGRRWSRCFCGFGKKGFSR